MSLASDRFWGIKNAVLLNPNCSLDILVKISKDKDEYMRYKVARHAKADKNLLAVLYLDSDPRVSFEASKRLG